MVVAWLKCTGVASFIEESVVRRELSDNYCFYNSKYDSVEGAAGWAQESLKLHSTDKREYVYTRDQLEKGKTHEPLWNAAQIQLVTEGKMHGFMRKALDYLISGAHRIPNYRTPGSRLPAVFSDAGTCLQSRLFGLTCLRIPVIAITSLSVRHVLGKEDFGVDSVPGGGAGYRDLPERSVRNHLRCRDLRAGHRVEFLRCRELRPCSRVPGW